MSNIIFLGQIETIVSREFSKYTNVAHHAVILTTNRQSYSQSSSVPQEVYLCVNPKNTFIKRPKWVYEYLKASRTSRKLMPQLKR